MQHLERSRRDRHRGCVDNLLRGSLALATLLISGAARTQTLARPGWAGSGMKVERWWTNAVLCEMKPDSLAGEGSAEAGSTLHRLTVRLDDLQTLGIDAVLLRDLEPEDQPKQGEGKGPSGSAVQIDERYGTIEEFDELVSDAVRHGIRVLVELRRGAHGTDLTDDERFWLSRGVTGLAVGGDDLAEMRAVRGVLRGYVGERVLIAEKSGGAETTGAEVNAAPTRARNGSAAGDRMGRAAPGDQPDLVRIALPPVSQGPAAMRNAIEHARARVNGRAPAPLLSAGESSSEMASARVLATTLLGSGGAVLLRVDDLDLPHADGGSTQSSIFNWYRQWCGLHRGNAVMRSGDETLLDHDAEGALVWVRGGRGGSAPIVAILNVADKPLRLSLVGDIQRLRLRGSFLRTISRSDGGMGAMPLREVVLPAFGVYVGELGR